MRRSLKRSLAPLLLSTAVAVLVAIAISDAAPGPRSATKHRVHASFSVFDRARAASGASTQALPASTQKYLTAPGTFVSELGLEPERAVAVQFDASNHGWVVPGGAGMCLLVALPISIASDCGPLENVSAGRLVMTRKSASGPVVYGLVPDGSVVTVSNAGGGTEAVSVVNDVFVSSGRSAESVSVRPPGGNAVTTPVN